MTRGVRLLSAMCLALTLGAGAAAAPLWGYVDADGVAHVAAHPVDSRYRLLYSHIDGETSAPPVRGKTHTPDGLVRWLAFAPEAASLRPWLNEAARAHGVDADLLLAIATVESGLDASAVSPRGAVGLLQLMPTSVAAFVPATRQPAGTPEPAVKDRLLDPRLNLHAGAKLLATLQRRHPLEVALAAWNAGEGTVRRHGGALPPIEETRAHVQLVLELYWALLQDRQARQATRLRLAPSAPPDPATP